MVRAVSGKGSMYYVRFDVTPHETRPALAGPPRARPEPSPSTTSAAPRGRLCRGITTTTTTTTTNNNNNNDNDNNNNDNKDDDNNDKT